ncbi:hypothetical protein N2152v2_001094 [Parachlorella kessleri]
MQGLMQPWPLVVTNIIDYAARFHGDQEVVGRCPEGYTITTNYREVRQRAQLCALALKRLGVRPGDRVGTLAWNTTRHLEAWYGISGSGAVCHTLNPRLFEKELEYIINHGQDTIIMADISFAKLLENLAPKLRSVREFIFLTDERQARPVYPASRRNMPKRSTLKNPLCYEELLEEEVSRLDGFKWDPLDEDQACGLCYTSGTTGNPKGVLYSHRANFLHAMVICLPDCLDLKSNSSVLAVVPMFHANAWGLTYAAPLVGAKLVLPGPFLDGTSVERLLVEQRVTHTAGVPTVWLALMEHLQRSRGARLAHLQIMVVGGAACPRSIIEYYRDEHSVDVRQLWGMTEMTPAGTMGALKGTLAHLDQEAVTRLKLKQGRGHIFVEMRIVDDEGRELPWDGKAFGNLQVKGPHVISRYFNSDAQGADPEGWFDTGDVATIDQHGYMQITDRSKDVIKSGGEWISSIEIENVAMGHPKVSEAAVIGIPDPKWSERPLLIVVPKQGQSPTREEILGHLEGRIARWWMPDDVAFVKEIPHTATGKISKLTLRRMFQDYKPAKAKL